MNVKLYLNICIIIITRWHVDNMLFARWVTQRQRLKTSQYEDASKRRCEISMGTNAREATYLRHTPTSRDDRLIDTGAHNAQ